MTASGGDLAQRIRELIHREGPVPFHTFMSHALYDPGAGFFAAHGAGRREGDFLTSPEVGGLFGACVARALDGWWHDLGEPDPFVVIEVGAGRGVLARDVLRADPACAPALRYVLVEQSERLRAEQRTLLPIEAPELVLGPGMVDDEDGEREIVGIPGTGPVVTTLDDLPALRFTGVVLANELLDNLPFDIVETDGSEWFDVRVGADGDAFVEVLIPLGERMHDAAFLALPAAGSVPSGTRLPVPIAMRSFVATAAARMRRGVLACIDYAEPYAELVARRGGWLRTYAAQERSGDPLTAPGTRDITSDVPIEAFIAAAQAAGCTDLTTDSQGEWLRGLGIDHMADEAAAYWRAHAATGDLAALAARSRVHEADALTDPSGLGAFRVLVARKR